MPQFGELLQATSTDASLLVLFIPSADREGDALGKKEQKRWVRKALKLLGEHFTGATAFPRGWGNRVSGGFVEDLSIFGKRFFVTMQVEIVQICKA